MLHFIRFSFVRDNTIKNDQVVVPICKYGDKIGKNVSGYTQTYCDKSVFQPTFNEYGMCYTFNNRKQGMDEYFSEGNQDIEQEDLREDSNAMKGKIDFRSHNNVQNDEKEIFKVTTLLYLITSF